jgi:hypothetical protein
MDGGTNHAGSGIGARKLTEMDGDRLYHDNRAYAIKYNATHTRVCCQIGCGAGGDVLTSSDIE